MPTHTYIVVDARRDNTIRIPRSELTVALGTPNACNNCHGDRSSQWAADQIAAWFGPSRRNEPHYGTVISAGRREDLEADRALGEAFPRRRRARNCPGDSPLAATELLSFGADEIKAYLGGLKDSDPLLRLAAVEALALIPPHQRVVAAAPLLDDKVLAVRIDAARSLAAAPPGSLAADQQAAFERASRTALAAEQATAERPETQLSIGAFLADHGRNADAEARSATPKPENQRRSRFLRPIEL
jgi:hypothetical protein